MLPRCPLQLCSTALISQVAKDPREFIAAVPEEVRLKRLLSCGSQALRVQWLTIRFGPAPESVVFGAAEDVGRGRPAGWPSPFRLGRARRCYAKRGKLPAE